MGTPPKAAGSRFEKLIQQLAEGEDTNTPRREGFGTGSLFVGRKMFGLLDETGALVLKLLPPRVAELIAAGTGTPWHPGNGKPLKEYVAVDFARQAKWLALATESRTYMASQG
ncbi:MAG: hypothetical protein L3K18_08970 [Thermoplasmata archaeon]|nr:hypothetical protein [Thermoplasmata archaeon]MCI4357249.1 hypothetical protein [Thermoplasmata archaeon]